MNDSTKLAAETIMMFGKERMKLLFQLKNAKKGRKLFEKQEEGLLKRIEQLENRINYELEKHPDVRK